MKKKQNGNADTELWVSCFMAQKYHADHRTETAANGCEEKQYGFRNTKAAVLRRPFICPHKQKGSCIDYNEENPKHGQ